MSKIVEIGAARTMRIRDVTSSDRAALQALLHQVSVFEAHELRVAESLIEAHLAGSRDYAIHIAEEPAGAAAAGPRLAGFVCHGHNPVTDAVYDIYWIVVAPGAHRRGIGRALLCHAEDRVRAMAGRAVTIETSNRPEYRAAEQLYESCGYSRVAEIPDFYRPGDAMRMYMKVL